MNIRKTLRRKQVLSRACPIAASLNCELLESRMLLAAPVVTIVSPYDTGFSVGVSAKVSATFDQAMNGTTINDATFRLFNSTNAPVAGRVSYNPFNRTVTFDAAAPLGYAQTYRAVVVGGATGVRNSTNELMGANVEWSFTTAPVPQQGSGAGGPILVVTSSTNPFSTYYSEILRAEGLNSFATADIASITPGSLSSYDVVILGEMVLNTSQVTMLSDWVTSGGNLIAMRPDKKLAGLLGLSDVGTSQTEGYLLVDTASGPGVGITNQTVQYHGAADRYALNGATAVAALYSTATTATSYPAVTLRNVGNQGGQAAAFTFDLARSIVYTRQGNPAWEGQERDFADSYGGNLVRSNDLFYGGSQPDWVDLNKVAIPQADEQQRLLANMITQMNMDNMPLPRFWYLPNGAKAAVLMSGDDHGYGSQGTVGRFDTHMDQSLPGSTPGNWTAIRGTSYVFPSGYIISDEDAAYYTANGFEVSIHVNNGPRNFTSYSDLNEYYVDQLDRFSTEYPSVPMPSTHRMHAIVWSDYTTQPQVEFANRIRLDTNYYYYPPSWVNNRPGLFTGSALPMRFATKDGQLIDVYQVTTQMTDESNQTYPYNIQVLLDNALGSTGYYGVFAANMHTDDAVSTGANAIVDYAKQKGVPVVTARQILEFTDGRNGSYFSNFNWNSSTYTLSFAISTAVGANGLQSMVPTRSHGHTLTSIKRNGVSIPYTIQTVKGIEYAFFSAVAGSYSAAYDGDTTAPVISSVATTPGTSQSVAVSWTTDEVANSRVDYGTSENVLNLSANDSTPLVNHSLTLTNLLPNTTYYYRITSADNAGNTTVWPPLSSPPATFTSPVPSYSIWADSVIPTNATVIDNQRIEVGVKFRSDVDGYITGIRFYKGPQNTGTHTGSLWSATGTSLATAVFSNETPGGWQTVYFDSAAPITANTTYVASYHTTSGYYSGDNSYFASTGTTNGPLHALAEGEDGSNGVYRYGFSSVFPDQSFRSTNYWVDVVFTTSNTDTQPPSVTAQSPSPNATGVALTPTLTATFSEAVQSGSVAFALSGPNGSSVPGTLSYDSGTRTASFTPDAPLASFSSYTASVRATDLAGNAMAAAFTWSFTTMASDTTAPSVTGRTPASDATGVAVNAPVTVTFSEDVDAATITAANFQLLNGTTPVPATVSYNATTRTATLIPSSSLVSATTYTATISGVKDLAGNTMNGANTWSFTTVPAVPPNTYSLWSEDTLPTIASVTDDTNAYELGIKFRANVDGYVTGVRFYKGATNVGTHVGNLWLGNINLASATFINESATGWQTAYFSSPVLITAGTTYIASYHTSVGRYAVDVGYFNAAGRTNGPLYALRHGEEGPNGVFIQSSTSAAPVSGSGANYWVDVLFTANLDTTAPTMTGQTPAPNAIGVGVNAPVTATFSEDVDPATLTSSTFQLFNGTTPVPATVSYNPATRTATLAPSNPLSDSTQYTATISGVKDLAGNTMTTAVSWNFTTVDTQAPTITAQSPAPNATGVPVGTTISVTFSEAVQISSSAFVLRDATNTVVPASFAYNAATRTATLTPSSSLASEATYSASLSGVTDLAGNPLAGTTTWSFTTADVVPPSVTGRTPAVGATGVAAATTVTVTFSEPVQQTYTFELRDASNNLVPASVSYNLASRTATLTPASALASLGTYTASVSNVSDLAGNALSAPVTWSFTIADTVAPTVTGRTPAPNATNVPLSSIVTATFSEDVDLATLNGSTFQLKNGSTVVPASVTYTAATRTATLTPGSPLASATLYTATISGVKDLAGNTMAAVSWSFTTLSVDTTPPTVTAQSPTPNATNVSPSASVSLSFNEAVQWNLASFELRDAANALVPASVSYNSTTRTATLTPSGALANSAIYTARVSGVVDLAGNPMSGPVTWSFTTAAPVSGSYSFWSPSAAPQLAADPDTNAVELGVKFRSEVDGYITAIRFYKGAGNGGTHTGSLWSRSGTRLASVLFQNETATGWQTAYFSSPVFISANTTYIASYFAPQGRYAADESFFASSGIDTGPLHALRNGVDGSNGVYRYGATSGFPNSSYNSTNYWVDVIFTASLADTQAPTVVSRSPLANSGNVPTSSVVTATFSEAVQEGSYSFQLRGPGGSLVPASVSYHAGTKTVTLTPNVPLANGTVYSVSLSGAKDLAGNTMSGTESWSFTTVAADTTAPSVTGQSPTPNATGVATNMLVRATFSEPIDPASLVFSLQGPSGPVATSFSYDSVSRTVTWTPASPLASLTRYTATVSGAKDLAGNTMAEAVSWSFTTADAQIPAITLRTPAPNAVSVPINTSVTASFSEAVQPGSIVFLLRDANNNPVPTSFSYNSVNNTATWTPASPLASQMSYTATVSEARDLSGNAMSEPVSWSFSTADVQAPTIISRSPLPDATEVALNTSVTVTFSEAVQPGSINLVVRGPSNTLVPGNLTYNETTHAATFTPSSSLAEWSLYSVTVSGVQDLAGNALAGAVSWSFTTNGTSGGLYQLFSDTAIPAIVTDSDASAVELGVRFRSSLSGYITGIRFYKGPQNSGTHIGNLWSSSGTRLATAIFNNETASGWQTVLFSSPVAISADTIYVASYFAPSGHYSVSENYFAAGLSNGPLSVPANGDGGFNGVYRYGSSSGFPASGYQSSNYWVDVLFSTTYVDTLAPTIAAQTPSPNATNVSRSTTVTARFSESIQSSTLSFVLKDPNNNIVPATVTYDDSTKTATLRPSSTLSTRTAYTVTIAGVRDLAGNQISGPVTWSFTTA